MRFDNLQKSLVSKSVEDSKSFTGKSFNKIVIGIIDKMEPKIFKAFNGNTKTGRIKTFDFS